MAPVITSDWFIGRWEQVSRNTHSTVAGLVTGGVWRGHNMGPEGRNLLRERGH
jgi:hypothetical protein